MGNSGDNAWLFYFVGGIIGFILSVLLIRVLFSIPKFLRMKKAELELLKIIAQSHGATEDELKKIHKIVYPDTEDEDGTGRYGDIKKKLDGLNDN